MSHIYKSPHEIPTFLKDDSNSRLQLHRIWMRKSKQQRQQQQQQATSNKATINNQQLTALIYVYAYVCTYIYIYIYRLYYYYIILLLYYNIIYKYIFLYSWKMSLLFLLGFSIPLSVPSPGIDLEAVAEMAETADEEEEMGKGLESGGKSWRSPEFHVFCSWFVYGI